MCNCIMKWVLILSIVIILSEARKFSSLDRVYQKGVDAYSKERWSECIIQFEESLHLYKLYKSIITNCRIKCKSEVPNTEIENFEDLKIFQFFFKAGQCITQCQQNGFEHVNMYNNISDTVLQYLQSKKPYSYIHICYFQMNKLPKAASATYTYLVAHPDDIEMKKNLKYYVHQPEVDVNEVVNLEEDDYEVLYRLGIQAYKQKKWGETINNMEEAITQFFLWENSCRAECDSQPEKEWLSEFVVTISNNMASVLTCRQQCQKKLKPLYGSGVELLADVLNYLQISYYNLDRINNAAKAVATYLALYPNDEDMSQNKIIYQTLTDHKHFVEIPDIIYYFKRDKYEKLLIEFIHREHNSEFNANSVYMTM